MKLLHIIDRFNPLLGQEINFIARNSSREFDLTILTTTSLKPWNTSFNKQINDLDRSYEETYKIKIIRNRSLFEYGEKLWQRNLLRSIKKVKPDIIYVHGVEYITFIRIITVYFFKFKKPYRLVTDTHSLPVYSKGTIFRFLYYLIIRHYVVPLINRTKITTFYTAEENHTLLENTYRISNKLIKPFIIGADLQAFRFDDAQRQAIRKQYKIMEGDILIIFSGRMCSQKGPHLILRALGIIEEKISKRVHVIFIGFQETGYMENEFKDCLKGKFEIIIKNAIPSEELYKYYSASDLAVFPLESSLSSLECQACCLPVIMETNFTNNKRLLNGGITYDKGNLNDLANKVLLMIENNEERIRLSKGGYSNVRNNYDYLKNLRQMESCLIEQIQ